MAPENYFFTVFLSTILLVRVFLYLRPTPSPTIKGFRLHHYMYGLVLAPIGLLAQNVTLYAIGLGLFIDELTFLFINVETHEANYSATSLIGTAILTLIVFLLRARLAGFF